MDHLIVVDTSFLTRRGRWKPKVVGTYRLLLSDAAARGLGFYSGTEFDLAPLLQRQAGRMLLELGCSCVDPRYRARRVIDLLWQGIGIYAAHHSVDALIGCVSLPGMDVEALAAPQLPGQHAAVEQEWQVEPRAGRSVRLPRQEVGLLTALEIRRALPPPVKGYLRAGGRFSPEPVVDLAFGCMDLSRSCRLPTRTAGTSRISPDPRSHAGPLEAFRIPRGPGVSCQSPLRAPDLAMWLWLPRSASDLALDRSNRWKYSELRRRIKRQLRRNLLGTGHKLSLPFLSDDIAGSLVSHRCSPAAESGR